MTFEMMPSVLQRASLQSHKLVLFIGCHPRLSHRDLTVVKANGGRCFLFGLQCPPSGLSGLVAWTFHVAGLSHGCFLGLVQDFQWGWYHPYIFRNLWGASCWQSDKELSCIPRQMLTILPDHSIGEKIIII